MRKTTKLAGTKDMAKITQMDTRTSTEVVTLETDRSTGKKRRIMDSVRGSSGEPPVR